MMGGIAQLSLREQNVQLIYDPITENTIRYNDYTGKEQYTDPHN
jgi:hypothetical protein